MRVFQSFVLIQLTCNLQQYKGFIKIIKRSQYQSHDLSVFYQSYLIEQLKVIKLKLLSITTIMFALLKK